MFDELAALAPVAWELPMPSERRLRRTAQALCDHPANGRSLPEWARWAGLSPRSVSRHFVAETGLSFTAWRQRVRLMRALQWLAEGKPVAVTAVNCRRPARPNPRSADLRRHLRERTETR